MGERKKQALREDAKVEGLGQTDLDTNFTYLFVSKDESGVESKQVFKYDGINRMWRIKTDHQSIAEAEEPGADATKVIQGMARDEYVQSLYEKAQQRVAERQYEKPQEKKRKQDERQKRQSVDGPDRPARDKG